MTDQPAASRLANEALDHWKAGRLTEAARLYTRALELADPDCYSTGALHSQFAGVMDALERDSEALVHYQAALAHAQGLSEGDDRSTEVGIQRYFLAHHLVHHGAPSLALESIAPSLAGTNKLEWLLRFIEAEALVALGRSAEALTAARLSLAQTPSPEKQAELANRFAELGLPIEGTFQLTKPKFGDEI